MNNLTVISPWETEPDTLVWEAHDLACVILRGPLLSLCGYVGVTKDHPLYGKHYDNVMVEVHGGLTFSDRGSVFNGVVPEEYHQLWLFGFDCAHYNDLVPKMIEFESMFGLPNPPERGVYRDMAYVKKETEELAEQLRKWLPNAG